MADGKAFVVKPHDDHGEILDEVDMGAVCLAAPSAYDGKVYIQTKRLCIALEAREEIRWCQGVKGAGQGQENRGSSDSPSGIRLDAWPVN